MKVKVDRRAYDKLMKKLAQADVTQARVGVIASKGGNATRESGVTMVELAAIHEFGAPKKGIPERSFIRSAFNKAPTEFKKQVVTAALGIINDKVTVRQAIDRLGAWGATEVKKNITAGAPIPPPNAPSTIRQKGSDRPLVDTGRLVNSVTWVVE